MAKMNPGEGFCIRCKIGRQMTSRSLARYRNNMPVERGVCSVCGTKMCRMLTKEEALQYEILSAEGGT